MRVVSAAEIDAALAFPALVDVLAGAFASEIVVPTRHHHQIDRPDHAATLLLMPAWSGAGDPDPVLGAKVVTVYPDNATRALPSVMGSYLLMHGATGAPLAVMDGARLTLWRTAAASALAARHLARADASRMVMVGSGALCPFLVQAHASVRPITEVAVWNRRGEGAVQAARALQELGLPARPVEDLAEAVTQADIVSCATLSTTPLVQGEWLKPGAHLDLVGAFNLSMREADDEALRRARIFVDTKAALTEGGDVAVALRTGAIDQAHVRGDLAGLVRGEVQGRTSPTEVTLFKSVGTAIEDLAAAKAVWAAVSDE